jgi:ABC-type nitrate/sulfonate/bicarbonate transport system substrate-binding protein
MAVIAVASSTATFAAACSTSSGDSKSSTKTALTNIKLGYPSPNAPYAPEELLQSKPTFCDSYGVHVTSTQLSTSVIGNALESGAVQAAFNSTGQFVLGLAADPGATFSIGAAGPIRYYLYGSKDTKSLQDFNGGTIAASSKGSTSDLINRAYLASIGITKFETVYAGSTPAGIELLIAGKVAGLPTSPPLPASATAAGVHIVTDLTNVPAVVPLESLPLAANTAFYQKHHGAIVDLVKCIAAANQYALSHKSAMLPILEKLDEIPASEVEAAYQENKISWALHPYTVDDINDVANTLKKYGLGDTLGKLDPAASANTTIIKAVAGASSAG